MFSNASGPRPLDDLEVVIRSLSELKPNPRNARTHSRRQIHQIADSIKECGFNNPLLIDDDGMIIAGHGRIEAAKLLGMTEVPTVCLAHMNEAQKRACVIARLRIGPLEVWVDHELNGYPDDVAIPSYRSLSLTLMGDFVGLVEIRRGMTIPPGCVPEKIREGIERTDCRKSISSIEHLLGSGKGQLFRIAMGNLPLILGSKVFQGDGVHRCVGHRRGFRPW